MVTYREDENTVVGSTYHLFIAESQAWVTRSIAGLKTWTKIRLLITGVPSSTRSQAEVSRLGKWAKGVQIQF